MFHPLDESLLRGESEVLERYRTAINHRLNVSFGAIFLQLLRIGTSPAMHESLNPDQSEFLNRVKKADEKTVNALKKILEDVTAAELSKLFVHIYMKKPGEHKGKVYHRLGVVSFPFYQDLKALGKDEQFHGQTLRVKDREAMIGLLEYMFPNIDTIGEYNAGTDNKVAPWLDALMQSVINIGGPINGLVELFKDHFSEGVAIPDDWVESFKNLDQYKSEIWMIPSQAGNEGAPLENSREAKMAKTAAAAAPSPAPAPAAPANPNSPYNTNFRTGQPAPVPSPFQMAPAPMAPMPVYQQPAYQPPALHTAEGKLNMDAFLRTSGMVPAAPMPMGGQYQPRATVSQPMNMGYQPMMGMHYPSSL